MKLILFIIPLTAVFASASFPVEYNDNYDNDKISMNAVTCSGGTNGLGGHDTFGSLPTFPNIGGAYVINGYDSAACGSCWKLSYKNKDIYFTAIDSTGSGFATSKKAFEYLGGPGAVNEGKIDASATRVDGSYCGL
jgi:Cerato-platanin